MSAAVHLSVVITTYNNAATLGRCLDSCRFADEILVLDSFSTDDTLALAQAAGARIAQQAFKGYGPQKADAIAMATHPWVLLLDADEWLPSSSQTRIRDWLAADPQVLGARLPRVERLFWRYPAAGTRHNSYLRLFRRDAARMSASSIHAAPEVDGSTPTLPAVFVHEGEPDIATKISKLNHYSSGLVGDKKRHRWVRTRMLLDPPWTFFKSFVLRRQFRNGWAGFINSSSLAYYAFLKYAKLYEARQEQVRPEDFDES